MKISNLGILKYLLLLITLFGIYGQSQAQGLPDSEHRDKVIYACTACHGLDNIFTPSNKMSADDWEFYVYEMVARGAPVKPEDMQDIIDYLADNFSTK